MKKIILFITILAIGPFARSQTLINAWEYWFDNDYSHTEYQNIPETGVFMVDQDIDISALEYGLHTLHFRLKSENGSWSPVKSKFFTWQPGSVSPELSEITEYEYWFNDNYASATKVNTTSSDYFSLEDLLDLSELKTGLHRVNFRFKDKNGKWSCAYEKFFTWYIGNSIPDTKELNYFEYWMDDNYADAVKQPVLNQNYLVIDESLDLSSLKNGMHILHYRFMDVGSAWTAPVSRFFVKYEPEKTYPGNETVAYRYWLDNDSSTMKTVYFDVPTKSIILEEEIDVSGFPSGNHVLNIQFKDLVGNWSVTTGKTALFEYHPWAEISVSNNTTCLNEAIDFTVDTVDVTDILWDFGDGKSSDEFSPSHLYDSVGKFQVSVTVTHTPTGLLETFILEDSITVYPTYYSGLNPSADNIIANYSFNENADDNSGNARHGAVYGATLTTDRFGKNNSAYLFDGIDDYIDIGDWENGGEMSFTFWARWDAFNNYSRIVDLGNGASSNNIIVANYAAGDNLFFSVYNNSSEIKYNVSAIQLNHWDFFAATINQNGLITLYKNGEVIGQKTNGNVPQTMLRTSQFIGKSNFPADGYFKGAIDDLIIYNKALSLSEIRGEYNKNQINIPPVFAEICSSETPYIFGTQSLTQSGVYQETFQTVHGCDSVVTLILTVNSVSVLQPIYETGFEDDLINTLPSGWIIRYNGSGTADQKVVASPVKNGSQSFQVSGTSWAANLSKNIGTMPEEIELGGWMRAVNVLTGGRSGLAIGNPAVGTWGAFLARVEFYNGNLITYYHTGNSGGYGPQFILQPASNDTWYHAKIVCDQNLGTYKVFINNQQAVGIYNGQSYTEFPFLQGVEPKSIELYGNSLIYFDDVSFSGNIPKEISICSNDAPYIFGEQELYVSGEYSEAFQSVHGCDSVVTINLIVNPAFVQKDTVTVCESDLPYIYQGHELFNTGDYIEQYLKINGCDSIYQLHLKVRNCEQICQKIVAKPGWNILSFNNIPDSLDMEYMFQPFINNNSLIKIQDEMGNSLEDWGVYGSWTNNITNVSAAEGFKIKVSEKDSLEICGMPVEYPFAIALKEGWNIIGYPQTTAFDGMEVVQNLIDNGNLIKVQDENGNSIEDWGIFGDWQNNIHDFVPGEGYKVKVNSNDTLWIYESYPKSSTIVPEVIVTTHFKPEFEGNGVDHMNVNLVGLPVNLIKTGDELALFDGTSCVGSVTVLPHHLNSKTISIAASATDNMGMPGFTDGGPVTLKLWNATNKMEFVLEPEILVGSPVFKKHETTIASLEKYGVTGLEGINNSGLSEIKCYPNPFSSVINIEINLAKDSEVSVEVLNQVGQAVKLVSKRQFMNGGLHKITWNGRNESNSLVSNGIYHLRLRIDDSVVYQKIVFSGMQ